MDSETKKIFDLLYADKINVEEAAKALNRSIEEVYELANEYKYIPTSEEIRKVCEIEREAFNHIKSYALQKIETIVRAIILKSRLSITPLIEVPISVSTCGEEGTWRDSMQHSFIKVKFVEIGKDASGNEIPRQLEDIFKQHTYDAPSMKISESFYTESGITPSSEVLT